MKVALAISHGRMAPCFPGVELLVAGSEEEEMESVMTGTWHPLQWGQELLKRDIGTLLCNGIDMQAYGALRGNGIVVIPETVGNIDNVLKAWRDGKLTPPQEWPLCPNIAQRVCGSRRRRYRGGRQRW